LTTIRMKNHCFDTIRVFIKIPSNRAIYPQ